MSCPSSRPRADPVATLEAYNPPQPEFAALRAELARLRAADEADARCRRSWRRGAAQAGHERSARPGDSRAGSSSPPSPSTPELYDAILVDAVKGFQASAGLRSDGIVGKNTVSAMNRRAADPVETILINMERWRWMPRYLGDFYVRVNIPNYTLDVYRDGEVFYSTRVVVGKVGISDPDLLRRDGAHRRQSILERAGLDRPERDAAVDPQRRRPPRLSGLRQGPRQVRARSIRGASTGARSMRVRSRSAAAGRAECASARSSSSFRINTMSTCTTPRPRASSSGRSAPSATAACGS